jgi:predicted TIM-barrel fold metal-dependent hydrolase
MSLIAVDHPFEDMSAETAAFAKTDLRDTERAAVSTDNARAVFGLR